MARVSARDQRRTDLGGFARVRDEGLTLPRVEAIVRHDGAPGLTLDGRFLAALAVHRSAEPATLVVRVGSEQRAALLAEAADIYYVTPYYERQPVVLARLARLDRQALRDLLAMSWRLTAAKATRRTASTEIPDGH